MQSGYIKQALLRAASGAALLLAGAGPASAVYPVFTDFTGDYTPQPQVGRGLSGVAIPGQPALYFVRFGEAPLALYGGEVSGLGAIPKKAVSDGNRKLDVHSAQAHAYTNYLSYLQSQRLNAMDQLLGHAVDVRYQMQHALNAAVVEVTPKEAAQIATMEGVVDVQRDVVYQLATDLGPGFIGAATAWWGTRAPAKTAYLRTVSTTPAALRATVSSSVI